METNERQYDVVLFGATGYTGKRALQHLLNQYILGTEKEKLCFAIAGRSRSRLQEALEEVAGWEGLTAAGLLEGGSGSSPSKVGLIVADSSDYASLEAMCRASKVVLAMVGPFTLYGEALVAACVQHGCHYCDITGEVTFVREMVDKYHQKAAANNVKIVPFCGFDCIPSEVGTAFLQAEALRLHGRPCQEIRARITGISGGFSGGTIDSLLQVVDSPRHDELYNHNLLMQTTAAFSRTKRGSDFSSSVIGVQKEPDFGNVIPFFMQDINCSVVHWTNGLSNNKYGESFRYSEGVALKTGYLKALAAVVAMKAFIFFLCFRLTRPLIRFFLPKAGTGPSASSLRKGYDATFAGSLPPTKEDSQYRQMSCRLSFDGDPGYAWTGRFVVECGAMLAIRGDQTENQGRGGIFSPMTGIGKGLIPQLRRCGLRLELKEDGWAAA